MAKSQKRSNPAIRQLNPDVPHPAAGLKGKPDLTARPPVPDNKGQMRGDSTARPLRVAFIGNALPPLQGSTEKTEKNRPSPT